MIVRFYADQPTEVLDAVQAHIANAFHLEEHQATDSPFPIVINWDVDASGFGDSFAPGIVTVSTNALNQGEPQE